MEAAEGFSEQLASHGGWRFDLATRAVEWSGCVYRIHGVSPSTFEATSERIRELIHPDDLGHYTTAVEQAIGTQAPFTIQHRIIRPDGSVRTLLVKGAYMPGRNGTGDALVGTTEDVTEREGSDERLWHLANHDSLTGLFNCRRLMEELEREIAVAQRTGQPGAVLMLDLDDFKDVNDVLGHLAGDTMLGRVGEGLRRRLRSTDALARLGGDEYAIVLPDCTILDGRRVAAELIEAVRAAATVTVAGRERPVTVSIGVAPFGDGGKRSTDELLVEADLAMYRAKARGGGRLEVFDEEMRTELAERLQVEGDLRHALRHGELAVYYQPIISVADGSPVGCEALVRWNHPSRGLVAPQAFISVAEERGLIGEVGAWVLTEACVEARGWRRAGKRVYVSVNVSPVQLLREDVVGMVRETLDQTGLPAPLLNLEVTESSLIEDVTRLAPALDSLKGLGVRIAIDDFGGGASSLSYLSALPIDTIKIDRLFIEGVSDRPDDRAIIAAVLSLAEELDLSVIAEGVETERQHWDLRELGCRFAQGYLYATPCPASQLRLEGYSAAIQPGVGDPSVVREFMRQIGIPARVGV